MDFKRISPPIEYNYRPQSVAVGDFDNDDVLDIMITMPDTNTAGKFLGYGNGTFSDMINISSDYGSPPFSVVAGDFNNDRKSNFDILTIDTDSLEIRLQTG